MRFSNQVASQRAPWYVTEQNSNERLERLGQPIREHVANILRDGYTIIPSTIPKRFCEKLIAQFKDLAARNPDKFGQFVDRDGHYPRIVNLHYVLPDLFRLFSRNPLAFRVQEALFDATPCLYTSLFYERGSAQSAHRDSPYFTTSPEFFFFGVWVALEDANEENGALEVYAGGHKIVEPSREAIALKYFPTLSAVPGSSPDLWDTYNTEVAQRCQSDGLPKRQLNVKAGDTVIWHPQLPHGGGPIQNIAKSRFSFVMHTTPLGVPVYHMDKFFNPEGGAPLNQTWDYAGVDGAYYVNGDKVDFNHEKAFLVNEFVRSRSSQLRGLVQRIRRRMPFLQVRGQEQSAKVH